MHNDSVEKILERYFATVTRQPFRFRGTEYRPKPLKVSPLLLRGFTCPENCSGCCMKFTLDYLPSEEKPEGLTERMIEFNGNSYPIWTDAQKDNPEEWCRHSNRTNGRCSIYSVRPFSCDFELIRTFQYAGDKPNVLTQQLFGRGHSYQRVHGEKGALCEMLPPNETTVAAVVRKLERLKAWTDYFGLNDTWIPKILAIIKAGALMMPVKFRPSVLAYSVPFSLQEATFFEINFVGPLRRFQITG
ncbi:MAG: YkgJ family cysteine cluster protein [Verrucomicrobiia bacterium]